jgi:hypothetical protein
MKMNHSIIKDYEVASKILQEQPERYTRDEIVGFITDVPTIRPEAVTHLTQMIDYTYDGYPADKHFRTTSILPTFSLLIQRAKDRRAYEIFPHSNA